jgi:predicted DNA binding protein
MLEAKIAYYAPTIWQTEIIEKHDARINVLDWLADDEACCKIFVEIIVSPEKTEKVMEELRVNPAIKDEDLQLVGAGRIKGAITTDECLGCCSAIGTGVFQISGVMDKDGRIVQTVVAGDRQTIESMVSNMEDHGHDITLVKLATLETDEVLTSRQEDMLRYAMEKGYFDDPKRITLVEMAREFDVSNSTVSEMLRKSQRKLMGEYFKARA